MKNTQVNPSQSVEKYLGEIGYYLPVSATMKARLLAEIKGDVIESKKNANDDAKSLEEIFGKPEEVAKNIAKSQDWIAHPGSIWLRILAWLVDLVIIGLIGGGIFYPFTTILGNRSIIEVLGDPFYLVVVFTLVTLVIVVVLCYFVIMERKFAATIGKMIFGLIVCDESGIRINVSQAILRSLSKFQLGLLALDFILAKLSQQSGYIRSLDALAKTHVIKRPK